MDGEDVRPFQFGSDDLSLLGDYHALRIINERFARLARSVFLPMLRIQPRISSFPPEVKTFDEYTAGIENFMSLNISSHRRTSRQHAVGDDTEFHLGPDEQLLRRQDRRPADQSVSEFTATEERIIELVNDGLNETLQVAWRDLMPITSHAIRTVRSIRNSLPSSMGRSWSSSARSSCSCPIPTRQALTLSIRFRR